MVLSLVGDAGQVKTLSQNLFPSHGLGIVPLEHGAEPFDALGFQLDRSFLVIFKLLWHIRSRPQILDETVKVFLVSNVLLCVGRIQLQQVTSCDSIGKLLRVAPVVILVARVLHVGFKDLELAVVSGCENIFNRV
jgi:hypothetical protein